MGVPAGWVAARWRAAARAVGVVGRGRVVGYGPGGELRPGGGSRLRVVERTQGVGRGSLLHEGSHDLHHLVHHRARLDSVSVGASGDDGLGGDPGVVAEQVSVDFRSDLL